MAKELKVTLIKSPIAAVPKNKKTVAALAFTNSIQPMNFLTTQLLEACSDR